MPCVTTLPFLVNRNSRNSIIIIIINMILSVIGATSLWLIVIWAALLVFFSPVLFVVSVCLPELPLLLIRRLHYVPFDAV